MRIATWNLNRARPRRNLPGLLAQIHQIEAHVWVLTETNDQTIDLSRTHPYRVSTLPVAGLHSSDERWTTIWSQYPTEPIASYDSYVAACGRVVAPLGPLLVYGTVLPWQFDKGPTGKAKGWTEFQRVLQLQQKDWEQLHPKPVDTLDRRERFCVAGDLNQSLDGRRWKVCNNREFYGSKALREALLRALDAADLECVTQNDLVAAGHLTTRSSVDHICLSAAMVEGAIVGAWEAAHGEEGRQITDHNGVYVDLPG
jgi:hypothetical protein